VVVVVEAKRGKDLEIILSPACYGTTNIRYILFISNNRPMA
jgi:hypothetical protein